MHHFSYSCSICGASTNLKRGNSEFKNQPGDGWASLDYLTLDVSLLLRLHYMWYLDMWYLDMWYLYDSCRTRDGTMVYDENVFITKRIYLPQNNSPLYAVENISRILT